MFVDHYSFAFVWLKQAAPGWHDQTWCSLQPFYTLLTNHIGAPFCEDPLPFKDDFKPFVNKDYILVCTLKSFFGYYNNSWK